jgi:ApaG protein
VDQVRARGDHVAHLFAQAREIGGKDARGDAEIFSAMALEKCVYKAWRFYVESAARALGARGFSANIVRCPRQRNTASQSRRIRPIFPTSPTRKRIATCSRTRSGITNNGNATAQLVSRHWIITDADNQVQEVRGMGVVGEQPVLKPGDTFEYSSGSSIPTAVGTMRGSYQLVAEDGTRFEASIPEFTLSVPRVLH